ncbi:MAG: choline ABC transporter permease subunit [Alphaproteobacteria bacterium]|nr:choline ABC transporter permease subunit [Alphaproteobacteria bacterium]
MDGQLGFLTDKVPIGKWVASGIDFVKDRFFDELRAFSDAFGWLLDGFAYLLGLIPPLAFIALVAAIAYWLHRSAALVVGVVAGLLLILNIGYWEEMLFTVVLVSAATVLCILFGIPIGIAAAHRPWLYRMLRPVLDLMQTIPPFVYLIPTLTFFGLGLVPGLISTVIFAIPAPIRLTHHGISSAPKPLIEAGRAFGTSDLQLLLKVELPHAMPTIMQGVTQCIMLSLSMVVIAALVGADGLGVPVVRALTTVNIAQGFEAGLSIVIVAILLDRILKQVGDREANGTASH